MINDTLYQLLYYAVLFIAIPVCFKIIQKILSALGYKQFSDDEIKRIKEENATIFQKLFMLFSVFIFVPSVMYTIILFYDLDPRLQELFGISFSELFHNLGSESIWIFIFLCLNFVVVLFTIYSFPLAILTLLFPSIDRYSQTYAMKYMLDDPEKYPKDKARLMTAKDLYSMKISYVDIFKISSVLLMITVILDYFVLKTL